MSKHVLTQAENVPNTGLSESYPLDGGILPNYPILFEYSRTMNPPEILGFQLSDDQARTQHNATRKDFSNHRK